MKITKGVVIDEPWIGYILAGTKTWEMRSKGWSHRGWFGLIKKGTGAVWGVARLVDVGAPLSPDEMIANFDKHRIPEYMIHSGEVAKWYIPWKLADVRRLDRPVPYKHQSGSTIQVSLDSAAIAEIARQLGDQSGSLEDVPAPLQATDIVTTVVPTASSQGRLIAKIQITEGNVKPKNNHFYLRSHIHKFPSEIIGGSNKSKLATRNATIDWGGPEPVQTDIDGDDKKFFRKRGWIGAFFKLNRAQAGDVVVIEETGPCHYRVRLKKAGA